MSDNDQKPGKVIRTSSGSTRLSAGGGKPRATDAGAGSPVGSGPAGAQSAGPATRVDAPPVSGPADRSPSGAPAGSLAGRQTGSAPTAVMDTLQPAPPVPAPLARAPVPLARQPVPERSARPCPPAGTATPIPRSAPPREA